MLTLSLSACVAPMLLLSPQGQLMWALLKPLVGLDPKTANLFEQPLLKGRMQALLGDNYSTAVSLLNTANKIQQEGPLFYLVSNYTPVPQLAEKAGFVWNAETNQMAVLLVSGGAPLVFAEQLNQQAAKVIPSWPAELVDYTDPVKLKKMALTKAATSAGSSLGLSENQTALVTTAATGGDVKALAVTQATDAATDQASSTLGLSKDQTALVKTAATGGDVKALAVTQATDAATDKASSSLGLSENQTVLVKTAATGGDVKALAVTQATDAATTKATEVAKAKATDDLGLTAEQAEAAAQLAKGASFEELSEKYQQQSAAEQIKEQKQQFVTEATDPIISQINTQKEAEQQPGTQQADVATTAETTKGMATPLPPVLETAKQSVEDLTAQLAVATEQEMAAEMALEQAEAKIAAAEAQLSRATTGALQDSANSALVKAQAELQAASEALSQAQQKVQQLQQQLTPVGQPQATPVPEASSNPKQDAQPKT